jgi:hypothetical protein
MRKVRARPFADRRAIANADRGSGVTCNHLGRLTYMCDVKGLIQ